MEAISQDEAFARIRLLRSPGIGPISFRQLLRRHGSATVALADLNERTGGEGASFKPASEKRILQEILAVRTARARYIFHDSADYPALLGTMEGAPPILTCQGNSSLAARQCVAIVGARNASAAAVRIARQFAGELSEAGIVVVSGLARGIDGAAHQASLAGGTIGVIASGIDIAYPPEHTELQQAIADQGLLLAEQPVGTEPLARHFPSRNRIIAGLAAATLVVEAAPKSGSLITARLAAEAGREVMAVPGSPLDSRSQGCNQLIREGAVLVQCTDDIIELLQGFDLQPRLGPSVVGEEIDSIHERPSSGPVDVVALLSVAPVTIDELIRQSGESAAAVQMALLELELSGRLVRHAGGRVSVIN